MSAHVGLDDRQRAAAVLDRGLGRRRQVDADRPAALRHQDGVRGSAPARRGRLAPPRRRARQPRAAHRRPARRARAGHHDRRRLPLLRDQAAQVHHRRHARATSSTRATWSPARRPRASSIILVDARQGSSSSSGATRYIASLLRIPHLVFAVNKMDLVDWDEATFRRIEAEFRDFAARLDVQDIAFIPISALTGANVVDRSAEMPWYHGPTLLYHLETVPHRERPQPDRRAVPGAVGDPAAVADDAPRLSRLRRPGRRRRAARRATT